MKTNKNMENLNYQKTIERIRKILKNYLVDNNIKSMIVGVSGGADSALVCALAFPVAKELGIELIGRSITIQSNKEDERERAKTIGTFFCTNFEEIDLTDEFHTLKDFISVRNPIDCVIVNYNNDTIWRGVTETNYKIRMGNVKARMRMIYLYDLAQKNKGIVMGTENSTEHFLGFFTLFGDAASDYEPIQGLWKTEVYNMIEWISKNENLSGIESNALTSMLDAVATDGLGITGSDLDQILPDWKERHSTTRQGYKEVDEIFEEFFNTGAHETHPVILRHLRTEFKRNHPINLKRKDIII